MIKLRLHRTRNSGSKEMTLPVSVLQWSSIFSPAGFGRGEALDRTKYSQWFSGVGEEGVVSDTNVDVLLMSQWKGVLLSDYHWSVYPFHWGMLWPVGQSLCKTIQIQIQSEKQNFYSFKFFSENWTLFVFVENGVENKYSGSTLFMSDIAGYFLFLIDSFKKHNDIIWMNH